MHTPLNPAAFSAARQSFIGAASLQDAAAHEMLKELGLAYADAEYNPLSHIEWHEVDFSDILSAWHEALLTFVETKGQSEHPGKAAMKSFLHQRIQDEDHSYHRKLFLDASYGRRSMRRITSHLAKQGDSGALQFQIVDRALEVAFSHWVDEAMQTRVPPGYFAELCFVPNWDGRSVDDMIDQCALRSDNWHLRDFSQLQATDHLSRLLKFLNISKGEFINAVAEIYPDSAKTLRKKWAQFKALKDRKAPTQITPQALVSIIAEAGTHTPVLMVHGQVDVSRILSWDPSTPMRWRLDKHSGPKVHIGMHDVVNGAGYMDVFEGEVIIPACSTGFGWKGRWGYDINDTYGIYTPAVRVTPELERQAEEGKPC